MNIVDDGNNKPSSVEYIETFADSKLVKHQVLQLRALVNYRLGDIIQANTDAKVIREQSHVVHFYFFFIYNYYNNKPSELFSPLYQ